MPKFTGRALQQAEDEYGPDLGRNIQQAVDFEYDTRHGDESNETRALNALNDEIQEFNDEEARAADDYRYEYEDGLEASSHSRFSQGFCEDFDEAGSQIRVTHTTSCGALNCRYPLYHANGDYYSLEGGITLSQLLSERRNESQFDPALKFPDLSEI